MMVRVPQDRYFPSPEQKGVLGLQMPTFHKISETIFDYTRVLAVLRWLISHNCHYRDLLFEDSLLSSWPDEFVPPEISMNIGSNHMERANLDTDNRENDRLGCDVETIFASGSLKLCTDVNGERLNTDIC